MILFLDDDHDRYKSFERNSGYEHSEIYWAYNVEAAKRCLDKFIVEEAHLDHDLADYSERDEHGYRVEYTGLDVARYIASMPEERRPKRVTIHSWNPAGAGAMQQVLRDAGVRVTYAPFTFEDR